jgi:transcriptional regulator with XRE-family HTH domain
MGKKTEVPITGSVLAWALDEAGMSVEELARRAGVEPDTARQWLSEDVKPGKTEFNRIVEAVRRPSAIFFMPTPPVSASLPTSFRAAPGLQEHQLSPSALREVRKARRLQRVVSWLAEGSDEAPVSEDLPRIDAGTVDPTAAGADVRGRFQLSLA